MELLSNIPVHHAVPHEFIMPPEKRPENYYEVTDPTVTLPVVNLAAGRQHVIDEIIKAGKEFGFFQVRTSNYYQCTTSTTEIHGD